MKARLEQRSYETGLSQVAIINAALEDYLAHVPSSKKDSDNIAPDHNDDGSG